MKHKPRKSEPVTTNVAHIPLLHALSECAAACSHCVASCFAEDDANMRTRCIELNYDSERICQLASSFVASRSEFAHPVLKLCAEICSECADECGKHDMIHCRECEEVCRRCVKACNEHYEALWEATTCRKAIMIAWFFELSRLNAEPKKNTDERITYHGCGNDVRSLRNSTKFIRTRTAD